jgi:hypothetical protein
MVNRVLHITFLILLSNIVYAQKPSTLPNLKAVLIVGPQEDGTEYAIYKMENLAKEFQKYNVIVYKFYDENAIWDSIVPKAKIADFFVYSGHGTSLGLNGESGGLVLTNFISVERMHSDLKFAKHPAILFQSVCRGAGSSAADTKDIGIIEATKRVTDYSKPFFDMGASFYYANNFTGGCLQFLENFFNGLSIESCFTKSAAPELRANYKYNPSMKIAIASNDFKSVSTLTTYENGIKFVKQMPTFKNYDIAFVGNPEYTILQFSKDNNVKTPQKNKKFDSIESNFEKAKRAYMSMNYSTALVAFKDLYSKAKNNEKEEIALWIYKTNKKICLEKVIENWRNKYYYVGTFHKGIALVVKDYKFGYVDSNGIEIVAPIYELGYKFSNGLGKMYEDGVFYFFDKKGNLVFKDNYQRMSSFQGNYSYVYDKGKYGVIKKSGKIAVPFIYENLTPTENSFLIVKKDGKVGVINYRNEILIKLNYDDIYLIDEDKFVAKKKNKEIAINSKGRPILFYRLSKKLKSRDVGSEKVKAMVKKTNENNKHESQSLTMYTDIPTSRFLDTIFFTGTQWISYNDLITMDINKLKAICVPDSFKSLLQFGMLSEHNYIRFLVLGDNGDFDNPIEYLPSNYFLKLDEKLISCAQSYSVVMNTANYLAHSGVDGSTMESRIEKADYKYKLCEENIAQGQNSINEVLTSWCNSFGHYRNIYDFNIKDVGFGFSNYYWVANFGLKE